MRTNVDSLFYVGHAEAKRMIPRGEVEELVGTAVYLASDAASFMTGQTLFVDDGLTTRI